MSYSGEGQPINIQGQGQPEASHQRPRRTNWLIPFLIGILTMLLLGLLYFFGSPLISADEEPVETRIISDEHQGKQPVGKEIIFSTSSQYAEGISKVEFYVDDNLALPEHMQVPPFPQVEYLTDFSWSPPTEGTFHIELRAYGHGTGNITGSFTTTVVAERHIVPKATSIAALATPVVEQVQRRPHDMLVIEDIKLPLLLPTEKFTKTWRIRNIGTESWNGEFFLENVAGPSFGAERKYLITVPPDGEVLLHLPMQAPSISHMYQSDWQLHDAMGRPFGEWLSVWFRVDQQCNMVQGVRDFPIKYEEALYAGKTFEKTWRVKNVGICNWDDRYYIDHVAGATLGGSRVYLTTVPIGSETDITIPMIAPETSGYFDSEWQLFNPDGIPFGPIFTVTVDLEATCVDPVITQFEADPTTIKPGQSSTIRWTVEGTENIRLNPTGQQLTPASGTLAVNPVDTTVYTLEAISGECVESRELTITVRDVPFPPSNLRSSQVAQVFVNLAWDDNSNDETGFTLYNADTNQPIAVYPANSTLGVVGGLTCETTYRWLIRATNDEGPSEPSNIVVVTTNAC